MTEVRPRVRPLPLALAVVSGIALLALVAWPDGWAVNRLVVRIWLLGRENGAPRGLLPEDYAVMLNVLLFVPATALVALAFPRLSRWWVLAGAVAVTLVIETLQGLTDARRFEVLDLVANTAGAVVGVGIAWAVERRLVRR